MRQATCLFTGSLPGYGNQQSTLFATRWNFFFFFFPNMEYVSYRPFIQQWISPLISLSLHEILSLLQLFAQYRLFPSLLIRSYSWISSWRTLFTFISNLYFPVLSEEYTCLTQNKFTHWCHNSQFRGIS